MNLGARRKVRATGVSFHVSRTGVPILVKTSYFPNWTVEGARGVYRSTPNFMVVVPTSNDVHLTYGTTTVEWTGRILTLVAALVGKRYRLDEHRRRCGDLLFKIRDTVFAVTEGIDEQEL